MNNFLSIFITALSRELYLINEFRAPEMIRGQLSSGLSTDSVLII
jgi:hypothetical protein